MKEFIILLSPVLWSVKNDILRFNRVFYKKVLLYLISGSLFIALITKLLTSGIEKLQGLSPEVFNILMIKGYSLIFLIVFFIQIIDAFIISFNQLYQSRELDLLFTSPVNRTALFCSRLLRTHIKSSWMLIVFSMPLILAIGIQYRPGPFYYAYSTALLVIFSVVPVNTGVAVAIMLCGQYHVKKLKNIVLLSGIITVVGSITAIRMFRPERFVNPELFANLKIFISELEAPVFFLLPSRWYSESIFSLLNREYFEHGLFAGVLVLTAYVTTVLLYLLYSRYHYRGWRLLQGVGSAPRRKSLPVVGNVFENLIARPVRRVMSVFDMQAGALFKKDLFYQFHDVKNIQQNLVLLSLITVYLFSIASLPLNWEKYGVQLRYMISFLNVGLILIIIASLCSKLVYPAIVSDGAPLWILKTAPLTARKYIWIKSVFLFLPILALGLVLAVVSSTFVRVEDNVFFINVLTTALVCLTLVSMVVMFGINDMRKIVKDHTYEEIKTGNTAYMLTAIVFILATLALEIIPIYLYFLRESVRVEFTGETRFVIGSVVLMLVLLNTAVTAFSIRTSIRRFERIEMG